MDKILGIILLLFQVAIFHGYGQANQAFISSLDSAVREVVKTQQDPAFNGTVLIGLGGEVIISQNYGYIDVNETGPIDMNTRFNVGSISKQLPAMALIDLDFQGQVKLHHPVTKYLENLPKWAEDITLEHLLTYKSGLPLFDFDKYRDDESALEATRKIEYLVFEPGSAYLYGNWNNFLQAKVVEAVTGIDFQTWIQTRYFNPIGLSSSFYGSSVPYSYQAVARGYSINYGDDVKSHPIFKKFRFCHGPLYMTSRDLFKWMEFVHERLKENDEKLKKLCLTREEDQPGPLGVFEVEDGEIIAHNHAGQAYSNCTVVHRNYKNGLTLVLMSNRGQFEELNAIKGGFFKIFEEFEKLELVD